MSEDMQKIVYLKGYFFQKITGTIGGYLRRVGDLFRIRRYDIVYLFLWATPFGPPISEWMIRKLVRKIVYDIDDLIYKAESSPNNKFVKYLKSAAKVDFSMQHADHVLVSTDKLFNYTKQFTPNVSQIPATIDVKKYSFSKTANLDKVVIGWSGSHSTSKYLHLLDNVFRQILIRHSNVKIMVMGDKTYNVDGCDIELVEWTAKTEIPNLQQFDIGLHPVPDEEWVYGKSGGKLVQYMAAGIPIVASAIGPNFKAIKDGDNGFLVKTDEEWISKLELLITDAVLRKQMGVNSKKRAVEFYSVEANLDKYLAAFK